MPISTGFESRRPGDIIRAIPALWIAAIALKVLVWLAAPADIAIDRADRAIRQRLDLDVLC